MAESTPSPRRGRLLLAGEQLDAQAHRAARLDQDMAVGRIAHRGGGDGAQVVDAHRAGQRREPAQGGVGQRHRLGRDLAALGQAAAEPGHHLLVEQDRRQPRRPLVHHQPDGVRADVDDRGARRRVGGGRLGQRLGTTPQPVEGESGSVAINRINAAV